MAVITTRRTPMNRVDEPCFGTLGLGLAQAREAH